MRNNGKPPFATREVPARELREGMTLVAMPEDCQDVHRRPDGTWPKIVGRPEYSQHGEGSGPCIYWDVDLPELCGAPPTSLGEWLAIWWSGDLRCKRHFYTEIDRLVTVAAEDRT